MSRHPVFGDNHTDLLCKALDGNREALGALLEEFRNYLLVVAFKEFDPSLRSKVGLSDIVQQTFLEAQRDFRWFSGSDSEDLLRWLLRILKNNSRDTVRHYRDVAKRDTARERSIEQLFDTSSCRLPCDLTTPSRVVSGKEQFAALLKAVDRLPEDQRRAFVLRSIDQMAFGEIGRKMNRSSGAARMLWIRAVKRIETVLNDPQI